MPDLFSGGPHASPTHAFGIRSVHQDEGPSGPLVHDFLAEHTSLPLRPLSTETEISLAYQQYAIADGPGSPPRRAAVPECVSCPRQIGDRRGASHVSG